MAYSLTQYMNRRLYLWTVLALIGIQAVTAVLSIYFADFDRLSSAINTGVLVLAALASGARLADAGYHRWIGIAAVIFIGWVVPFFGVILWLAFLGARNSGTVPDEVYYIGFGATVLLLLFVVWAASRPSVARQP